MNKPEKPNITIPESFAVNGVKADFDSNKILNGFDRLQPDVLAGDNLNKFIDDTYKGLNYALDFGDYIDTKVNKSGDTMTGALTMNAYFNLKGANNNLDYTSTTAPASDNNGGWMYFRDKNNNVSGQIFNQHNAANNSILTHVQARRIIDGETKTAAISVGVDGAGNTYATAPAATHLNSIVTTVGIYRAPNGYVKFGNGIILQWGTVTVSANATSVKVTLPISFSSTSYSVGALHYGTNANSNFVSISISEVTQSGFTLTHQTAYTGAMTRRWLAIGF